MYFRFDISFFIKLRTSPFLESYLAMKFLFHHLHLSHLPASLPNLWFSVLNIERSSSISTYMYLVNALEERFVCYSGQSFNFPEMGRRTKQTDKATYLVPSITKGNKF